MYASAIDAITNVIIPVMYNIWATILFSFQSTWATGDSNSDLTVCNTVAFAICASCPLMAGISGFEPEIRD